VLAVTRAAPAGAGEVSATAQTAITLYRHQHGLPAVAPDPRLMALAAEQARAMAKAGALEHDVDRPFQVRIVRYDPDMAVENIAAGTTSFASTLELWKHSAGHDANLRKAGVTRFGIASADAPDSKYKVFWSLIMAAPHARRPIEQATGPRALRAASTSGPGAGPSQGPVVRVRTKPTKDADSGVVSGLKRLLSPLWQAGASNSDSR
jgi:hypothetical protein